MKAMKHLFLLVTALFSMTERADAQVLKSGEQRKVEATVEGLFAGIAELNPTKIKAYVTADMVLLENGAVWTVDSLVKALAPLNKATFSRKNTFEFMRTDVTDNTAWVAYRNTAEVTKDGRSATIRWLESATLVKVGDAWKIKLLHVTKLSAEPK